MADDSRSPAPNQIAGTLDVTKAAQRHFFFLIGAQMMRYLVPLVALPILARSVTLEEFGVTLTALATASFLSLFVDFGLQTYGTREVARSLARQMLPTEVARQALALKTVMMIAVAAIGLVVILTSPVREKTIWASALTWAVLQGANPNWLLLGRRETRQFFFLAVAGTSVTIAATVVFVQAPGDGPFFFLALALGAGVPLVSTAPSVLRLAKGGRPFLQSFRQGAHAAGNSLILSVVSSVHTTLPVPLYAYLDGRGLPFFAASDRIFRVIVGGILPLNQALLPRMTEALSIREGATRLWLLASFAIFGFASAAALVTVFAANSVVEIVLGEAYVPAAPALMVLAVGFPVVALGTLLGTLWLVPLGREKTVWSAVLIGGLFAMVGGFVAARYGGPTEMAWAIVLAESAVTASLLVPGIASLRSESGRSA